MPNYNLQKESKLRQIQYHAPPKNLATPLLKMCDYQQEELHLSQSVI